MFDGQHSPQLVLALYSRLLGDPQPDWPANTVVTGHMFHDGAHGSSLDPVIERFLADGPPPVLFTLGSSAVLSPGRFWEESLAAIQRMGVRGLCLVGPGNVDAIQARAPRDVLVVERAPHSLVMPRSSVVVQQCGIGTLAQGLRSGVPLLAVPFAHDQPDNAYRAMKLGVARVLPPTRYRAARVTEELGRLTSDPAYREAAAGVACAVRAEGGVTAACDALEARFGLA
jgi:UDP:flavonoid glycosyltransferase YjiC (YdhE family)